MVFILRIVSFFYKYYFVSY